MSDHAWLKLYLELPTDRKLFDRSAHDCYLWVCLLILAKASEEPGVIGPYQARLSWLSKYAKVSVKEVREALIYFEEQHMIQMDQEAGSIAITHFMKRQGPSDPEAAKRKQKQRDRERDSTVTGAGVTRDVTKLSRSTRAGDRKTDRNPIGLLTEADTDSAREDDDGSLSGLEQDIEDLYGGVPPDERVVVEESVYELGYRRFLKRYGELSNGHPYDPRETEKDWRKYVAPGQEDAVLANLEACAQSDCWKRIEFIGAAKFIREWRQWDKPRKDKPANGHKPEPAPIRGATPAELKAHDERKYGVGA